MNAENDAIAQKFLKGMQTDEEMKEELMRILGDNSSNMDFMLSQAEQEKARQEQELKDRLAKRQKRLNNKIAQQKVAEAIENAEIDIIQADE